MTPDDDDLPSLDFTIPGAFDSPPPSPPPEPEPAPVLAERPRLPRVLEEAAALHAAGKEIEACKCLEAALKAGNIEPGAELRVWAALFDMLQILGRRPAFETLALAFARHFELSPPTWSAPDEAAHDALASTGGRAHVSLTGCLDASVGEALREGLRLAQTSPLLRIDTAKLRDADDAGCTLLLRAIGALKKAKKEFMFGSPEHLAALLDGKVQMGVRENPSMWMLLLELYQHMHRQEAFEEAAVNYAVTFEVSPPSWEQRMDLGGGAAGVEPAPLPLGPALRGQLLGAMPAEFAAIGAAAEAGGEALDVDASQLVRIDAASADHLKDVLRPLAAAGKRLRIVRLPTLVAAFLEARGLTEVAELSARSV